MHYQTNNVYIPLINHRLKHHQQLHPTTTINHTQPPSTTTNHTQPPSTTLNHHQPHSTTTNHTQPPSTTLNHHQPQSTIMSQTQPTRTVIRATPYERRGKILKRHKHLIFECDITASDCSSYFYHFEVTDNILSKEAIIPPYS